ncbi:hypothetical protein FGG08_002265 [Glutinoglossum americanum]|uniref:Zn(2)-C6 fungal-type domain-containing protein n=1 Tax=Glutinoglossum americanum TaxID=1670608 RepID=A0A9P8ID67_9PEZI|nr:hypothetical protein FGG08_002265 [Glutinoglossum americanum]
MDIGYPFAADSLGDPTQTRGERENYTSRSNDSTGDSEGYAVYGLPLRPAHYLPRELPGEGGYMSQNGSIWDAPSVPAPNTTGELPTVTGYTQAIWGCPPYSTSRYSADARSCSLSQGPVLNPAQLLMPNLTNDVDPTVNHSLPEEPTWHTLLDQQLVMGGPEAAWSQNDAQGFAGITHSDGWEGLQNFYGDDSFDNAHTATKNQSPTWPETAVCDWSRSLFATTGPSWNPQADGVPDVPYLSGESPSFSPDTQALVPSTQTSAAIVPNRPAERPPPSQSSHKQPKKVKHNEKQREKTKGVREAGACLRCRMYKKQCTEFGTCGTCEESLGTARLFVEPCYREHLSKVVAFRIGNSRMGEKTSEFPRLVWRRGESIREVELVYPFDHQFQSPPVLKLPVQKFEPKSGDILSEEWQAEGKVHVVELPPFASCESEKSLKRTVGTFMSQCHHPLLKRILMDVGTDEIVNLTMEEAVRYSNEHPSSVIHNALRIRSGVALIATTLSIQGNEKLDIKDIRGRTPTYFKIPLPTVLEYQIDTAAILVLKDLQDVLLGELHKLVFNGHRTEVWYEVFLVTFVLLSTLEYVYGKQQEYLNWHENTVWLPLIWFLSDGHLTARVAEPGVACE